MAHNGPMYYYVQYTVQMILNNVINPILVKHFLAVAERKLPPHLTTTIFAITPSSEKVQVIELDTHTNCGAITKI